MNNNSVSEVNLQKQLRVLLLITDNRLSFEEQLRMILNKVNETIGPLSDYFEEVGSYLNVEKMMLIIALTIFF